MKRIAISVLIAAGLTGCASVQPVGVGSVHPQAVRDKNYALGVPREISVGDQIIRARSFDEIVSDADAVQAREDITLSGGVTSLKIPARQKLPVIGEHVRNGVDYKLARLNDINGIVIEVAPDGSLGSKVITTPTPANRLSFPVTVVYNFRPRPAEARMEFVRKSTVDASTFKDNYEIIFNGIDGQAMHLQYREYTASDMARPAFSQELSYPIASKTIRFKKLLINVLDVNAERIRCVVVEDGDQAGKT